MLMYSLCENPKKGKLLGSVGGILIKELKYKDPCVDHVSKPCQNKDYVNAVNGLLVKI